MKPTEQTANKNTKYSDLLEQFVADVYTKFGETSDEISERNVSIQERDAFIYGDYLHRALTIPKGHDFTPANWLKRTVEIHKNMFMGRGFTVSSTYNTQDLSTVTEDSDRQRMELENQKQKGYAESRMRTIAAIKEDNGGDAFWASLAENASAVGDVAVMQYWNEDEKKVEQCQIENIENLYVLWNSSDFRKYDAVAYVLQVSKMEAISEYGAPEDVSTSPVGQPLTQIGSMSSTTGQAGAYTQPMVSVLEVTGKLEGWAGDKGQLKKVPVGQETEINAKIVGNTVQRLITVANKLPKYYILPNKRQRRRPWGCSDITDSAIRILLTYIETLSDWRTVASKVNFPKYKALGFAPGTQMPKYEKRRVQLLPLSENQDLIELTQTDSNSLDWGRQLDEIEKLYVREVAVASVLFNDPSITLNSNQALTTSMKPTTDVAEAKKQLWAPIIKQIYMDALDMAAQNMPEIEELVQPGDDWVLKVMWPSIMEKDDPTFQTMLLNRFNAGLMSAQTYLESQGENKEELDRIRDEINDPVTAAILSHGLSEVAKKAIYDFIGMPPWGYITPKVSLRGDLAPQEVGNMAHNYQWDQGPYGPQIGPQGNSGTTANDNFINSGFETGNPSTAQATYQGPQSQSGAPAQVTTPQQNQSGQQPMSQPGSGATSASSGGAVAQTQQNAGQ